MKSAINWNDCGRLGSKDRVQLNTAIAWFQFNCKQFGNDEWASFQSNSRFHQSNQPDHRLSDTIGAVSVSVAFATQIVRFLGKESIPPMAWYFLFPFQFPFPFSLPLNCRFYWWRNDYWPWFGTAVAVVSALLLSVSVAAASERQSRL